MFLENKIWGLKASTFSVEGNSGNEVSGEWCGFMKLPGLLGRQTVWVCVYLKIYTS
jgi:hypothetical protein